MDDFGAIGSRLDGAEFHVLPGVAHPPPPALAVVGGIFEAGEILRNRTNAASISRRHG
ncbi:hypothetical protein [Amycolatopsis japonica]